MTPARIATPRRLRRLAHLTSAAAICGTALALPGSAHAAGVLTPGNLLVSTSVYDDLPNLTAGSTVLPNSTTTAVKGVVAGGSGPSSYTATITASGTYYVGQYVTISGVGGATQVNGTFAVTAVGTGTFTISTGSTPVSAYTSGGTVAANIAIAGATYPFVFNNAAVDGNFGVTEPIVLDEVPATTAPATSVISQTVPNSDTGSGDGMVTSFSSKSELALNQSTDGSDVSFMGYDAPTAAIDVSNSNTPIEVDPTNSDTAPGTSLTGYYRSVATLGADGSLQFTETGAYDGNNGRAAVLDNSAGSLFTVGNAGNGANPPAKAVVQGAGSQILAQATTSQAAQKTAGVPAPEAYGNFSIVQTGQAADKSTKDDNFRGLTAYNGVIYASKGSGGNGINTVYFVDTTGKACPTIGSGGGVGLPQAGASLPSAAGWAPSAPTYNTSNAQLQLSTTNPGLSPTNMCVLRGFPTGLAKASSGVSYPFGIWFANPTTVYVADEGSGKGGTGDTTGGLQKWVLNTGTGTWTLAYTITSGLNLQTPYTSIAPSPAGVNGGPAGQTYPTGTNSGIGGSGASWTPANDGLRNLTGRTNPDGTVTLWATTSTISGSGDQGTDPNEVVGVTDDPAAAAPTGSFSVVLPPTDGVVYRGVSLTPGTTTGPGTPLPEFPWAPVLPVGAAAIVGGVLVLNRRRSNATMA